jgi:very-short-patch-repair endonuclease
LEEMIASGILDDVLHKWRPVGERFEFDFVVRRGDREAIVEVDGEQHFGPWDFDTLADGHRDRVRRDVLKMIWAYERGISVVRIPTFDISFDQNQRGWKNELTGLLERALDIFDREYSCAMIYADRNETLYSMHSKLYGELST